MPDVFGYGYVTKSKTNILRSTVYKALRGKFIPQENIYIDILELQDGRKKLHEIIDCHAKPYDTILILNRRTLGKTNEFKQWWQKIVFNPKPLNLLIVNEEEENGVDYYSTTDYSLVRYSNECIEERWNKLQTEVFERQTKQVGRKTAKLTDVFIEAYWAFQRFYITPDEAYQHSGVSKPTFYTLCRQYETTEEYRKILLSDTELLSFPKRGGLSKDMDKVFFAVEQQGKDIAEACRENNIDELLPEEYRRCLFAKQGGRKIQFAMEKEHYRANYFQSR